MQLDETPNPHYWLAAYGVRSPYFVWAVAHGWLDDIDTADNKTRGKRLTYRSRPPSRRDIGPGSVGASILPGRHKLGRGYVLK